MVSVILFRKRKECQGHVKMFVDFCKKKSGSSRKYIWVSAIVMPKTMYFLEFPVFVLKRISETIQVPCVSCLFLERIIETILFP